MFHLNALVSIPVLALGSNGVRERELEGSGAERERGGVQGRVESRRENIGEGRREAREGDDGREG